MATKKDSRSKSHQAEPAQAARCKAADNFVLIDAKELADLKELVNHLQRHADLLQKRYDKLASEKTASSAQRIDDGLARHLRFLIFAAHPDRNNNDPRAHEATVWLLAKRRELAK